ncbi:Bifunctional inhibitor/lipid-transfer protein/seed storage 2S albumin superfamily protein [Forsythia ovata]|uniref:Bifunctional inhibitor/lipid-transfer protein/seed storage 2S albumin superfamily protein n=1 Tax=Forsythia ovata TaxID=205694 RepID=A0ABD1PKC8_9LAMI
MDRSTNFSHLVLALALAFIVLAMPVYSQTSGACTGAMLSSFGNCIGFLTRGSNVSSPTSQCCSSLKSLMSNGQDCLCLIVTGGVPFQVPLNRTLAISLPRACRMSGVPIECKATSTPVPAPGPMNRGQRGSNMSPRSSPPRPTAPTFPLPFTPPQPPAGGDLSPPEGDLTPPAPEGDIVPTLTPPGMRPTLTPSAAQPSHSLSPSLLVAVLGVIFLKYY